MIPQTLTIEGLYSYREKQTIDFSALTDARLFGIFGQVGSGKSTILEAITFALFGKTDRLNLAGDNRNYNMMNLKSNAFVIEYTFTAGSNQHLYMSRAASRRNSKRFEDVKTIERSFYQNNGDDWEPMAEEAFDEVVGISYDNFRRTIIIPQGKFQEFLQLGNKDRTIMMKELFQLQKFELFYKVTSLEGKNKEKKQYLEGQLQQLGDIDPTQMDTLKKELEAKEAQCREMEKALEAKRKKEAEVEKLKKLTLGLRDIREKRELLLKKQGEVAAEEKMLKDFRYCQHHFKHLMEKQNDTANRKMLLQKEWNENLQQVKQMEEERQRISNEMAAIKEDWEQRERLQKEVDELQKMKTIIQMEGELQELTQRIVKGKQKTEENNKDLEALKNKLIEIEQKEADFKKRLAGYAILNEVSAWHTANAALTQSLLALQQEKAEDDRSRENLLAEISQLISQAAFDEDIAPQDTNKALLMLQETINKHTLEMQEAEQEQQEVMVKARLKEFSDQLQEGKPCPLCGSETHPDVASDAHVTQEMEALTQKRAHINNRLKELNKLDKSLFAQSDRWKAACAKSDIMEGKIGTTRQQIQEHKQLFKWESWQDAGQVQEELSKLNALHQELDMLSELTKKVKKEQDEAQKNKDHYAELLNNIVREEIAKKSECALLKGQLEILDLAMYVKMPQAEVDQKHRKLQQKVAAVIRKYEELNLTLQKLNERSGALQGSQDTLKKNLENEEKVWQTLHQEIKQKLVDSPWDMLDRVGEILEWDKDADTVQQAVNAYNEDVKFTLQKLGELEAEISGRVYDEAMHATLIGEIKAQNEASQKLNQETGSLKSELNRLQSNLKKLGELKNEHEQVLLREEDLRTMKSLFKGSGFVNYASSVHLQNLCVAANERFQKMTRQQLSLELTADNTFQVRDFMNGGRVRSVKTLSGGQTFQAALALALALADNRQQMNATDENFFFLDEGFGSLDKDSLDIVFDTLKTLRHENRIVGVISHVEEMQQEITTFLKVENTDEKGSIIKESWRM